MSIISEGEACVCSKHEHPTTRYSSQRFSNNYVLQVCAAILKHDWRTITTLSDLQAAIEATTGGSKALCEQLNIDMSGVHKSDMQSIQSLQRCAAIVQKVLQPVHTRGMHD